jgi:hypothetical protein
MILHVEALDGVPDEGVICNWAPMSVSASAAVFFSKQYVVTLLLP